MKQFLVLVVAFVLAGCVDAGSNTSKVTDASSAEPSAPPISATTSAAAAAPSVDTGSLQVQVTTTELEPVSTAQVTLADTDYAEFTDAAGLVTFNGLDPGSYTVLVGKPGYRAVQDRGRVVEVAANEIAEAKLTLDPVPVLDTTHSYYTTFPFAGFLSCAVEGADALALNRVTPCGNWIQPAPGVEPGDPNHKSRFTFQVDSVQVQGAVIDGVWEKTTGVTGNALRMLLTHTLTCSATCIWNDATMMGVGKSPIHAIQLDGPEHKIIHKWGEDPAAYPKTIYAEAGAYCKGNPDCTTAEVAFQQHFDMYVTIFYGAEPAADFSAIPE